MGRCLKLQGVPVDGYLHWTISDNWEWADGYCPKFGLVDVDRSHNLTRRPRPSYFLYQQVRLKTTLFLKNLYNFFYLVLACSIFRTVISVTMWAF
jgi:beta-glucosidase/6-phospho-beta-glucosidase/beta-galactosidase